MEATTATPRARAAWAFSGLPQAALAEKAGIHRDRLRALLGTANKREVTLEELYAVADAAGVPRSFMDDGFIAAESDPLVERIAALEDQVRDINGTLNDVVKMLSRAPEKAGALSGMAADLRSVPQPKSRITH